MEDIYDGARDAFLNARWCSGTCVSVRDTEKCIVDVVDVRRRDVEEGYHVEREPFDVGCVDECGSVGKFGCNGFEE